MPPESLTLIERYGSFGLVCVIVLAAIAGALLFLRFVKNDLVPRAFEFLKQKDADHAARLERRDAVCQEAIANVGKLSEVVTELLAEVRRMKDETAEHPRHAKRPG